MDIEEVKRRAELYSALAEGKTIQVKNMDGEWTDVKSEKLNYISEELVFRIKPEPKYRPFETQEECWQEMLKHDEFGWVKSKTRDANKHISNIEKDIEGNVWFVAASFSGIEKYSPKQMLDYFVFMDGEPFGIKEE